MSIPLTEHVLYFGLRSDAWRQSFIATTFDDVLLEEVGTIASPGPGRPGKIACTEQAITALRHCLQILECCSNTHHKYYLNKERLLRPTPTREDGASADQSDNQRAMILHTSDLLERLDDAD